MSFNVAEVEAGLVGSIFAGNFQHFDEIGSTNTSAMQAGAEGAPHGSVFVADAQTAGRGRGAHAWASPAGTGLYVSVLLRPMLTPGDTLLVSLAAGLAAQAAVRTAAGVQADLRWPNDLLADGRKLGGILCEMQAEAIRVRFLVVGIGINVHQSNFPPELATSAVSLAMLRPGKLVRRETVLVHLLRHLDEETKTLFGSPSAGKLLLHRFEAASSWVRGKRVTVGDEQPFSGTTEGLDARGFLRVRTAAGEVRLVLSGGVREKG